jgi:hypothetical protein
MTTLAAEPPIVYRQQTFAPMDTEGMTRALRDDGFALIPGVLTPEECAAARDKIDGLQPFGFDQLGPTDHFKCVFNREPYWLRFLDLPGIIDLAEAAMGAECHIIGQTAWRSHPGHNGWSPHTDRVFVEMPEDMAMDPRFTLPISLCTAHFYLSDITEDLCPTYVIPGSHRSGRALAWGRISDPVWHDRSLEPVVCKAGDVLFFRSEIWHSGSKNSSDTTRYLLQVHYSHRFISQKFSPWPFQYNPEILAAANERQLRLLGKHSESNYG